MAIDVQERIQSRKSNLSSQPSQQNEYVIVDNAGAAFDEATAQTYLRSAIPGLWAIPGTINQFLPIQSMEVEGINEFIYYGTVVWAFTPPQNEGDQALSFDTGGGRTKITQSLGTTSYAATGTAPNFEGAIGVTKDGVEGIEILVPALSFTITQRFAPGFVTNAYIKLLATLTGCVNGGAFRGCDPGEVLFEGATGTQANSQAWWDISFKFSAQQNASTTNGNALTVGTITNIDKNGFQYLWVRYQDVDDTTAKALVKQPLAVYVETVYNSADFSQLGIGT